MSKSCVGEQAATPTISRAGFALLCTSLYQADDAENDAKLSSSSKNWSHCQKKLNT